jgi:poly-gamma-glutamate capsule biosynthesis protein CapA/YwtB (metallophosphatase superfamily)
MMRGLQGALLATLILASLLTAAGAPAAGTSGAGAPRVVLLAAGDIMPVQATAGIIAARGPDYPFALVAPLLRQADIAFANLEAPLTAHRIPTRGKSQADLDAGGDYVFRGSPLVAGALRRAGISVVSVANNHAMDYGSAGLLETLARLERAGVRAVGAGATLAEARKPRIVEVRGIRAAFLAYSDVLPRQSVATATSVGIAPAKGYWTGRPAEDEIARDVRAARAQADHVVVSVHWGEEGETAPNCRQITLGSRIIAAGATAVLGHHPHVLQPVVHANGRLIAYSLGNLVASPRGQLARETALLRVVLGPAGVVSWEAIPVLIAGGQPGPARAVEHAAIGRRVKATDLIARTRARCYNRLRTSGRSAAW